MPALANPTQITPPRVPVIDDRTGAISREWYRFFLSLLTAVEDNQQDTTQAPPTATALASLDAELRALAQVTESAPDATSFLASYGSVFADAIQGLEAAPVPQVSNAFSTNYLDFQQDAAYTNQTARLGWNSVDQTLNLGMEYGVTQQIGQETYARVGNTTGVTIPNGTVVGFAGATANAILVSPYLANGAQPSLYILGVMTHDLPDSGEKGYCTTWGFVRDLNTSAFSPGDILYASPSVAGGLTNIKPTAPSNVIPVAACIVSNATTGVIFVRPTITQMQYYGVFTKTTDQTPAAIDTEYLLTFNNTQISNGVVIGGTTSRIIVPQSGLYQFDATVQLTSGSASDKNIWVWFKKNGAAIANSARLVTSRINNGYVTMSLSETVSLAAGGYIEMAFAANDTNITISTVAATAFAPAAPAIVLQVTQVQQ